MANVFDRSYRFYETGAPYPGICLTCSNTNKLWDLGVVKATNQGAYLCDNCLQDLALYAGFVLGTVHAAAVVQLDEENITLKNQLEAAPNLVKGLTHDINSLLSDFITGLAAITATNKPVQPQSDQANTGSVEASNADQSATRKATGQSTKPSTKSISE